MYLWLWGALLHPLETKKKNSSNERNRLSVVLSNSDIATLPHAFHLDPLLTG
jgi:hypothetical protein